MGKEAKTNAMRMLERAKVNYTSHEYPHSFKLGRGECRNQFIVLGVF